MSIDEALIRCPVCQETSPQGYILCPFCGADLTEIFEAKIFAPVTYKDVWRRIKSLFRRPFEVCQEIADNPDSKGTLIFLLAISIGWSFQILALFIHNNFFYWQILMVFFAMAIATLILPLLIWLFASMIIQIITKLLGGKAKAKQIRAAVGYGLMPVAVVQLFNAIFFLIALPWSQTNINDILAVFDAMFWFRNSFAGILALILNIISFLGAGFYIALTIKPAADFSWIEASIATGIPVIVFTVLIITYYFVP